MYLTWKREEEEEGANPCRRRTSRYIDFVIFACVLIGGFERRFVRRIDEILNGREEVRRWLPEIAYIVQSTFQSRSFSSARTIHRVVQQFMDWFGLFVSGVGGKSIFRYPLIVSMID